MTEFIIQNATPIISFLVLVLNIVTVVLVYALLFRSQKYSRIVLTLVSEYILQLGLLISLSAFIGSLLYSNVIGFIPCDLCWWERIFIYPQVVIYGVALYLKDKKAWLYSMIMAILTIVLAGYHSFIRFTGGESAFCSSSVVSCSKAYVTEFGYITIPTMALSTGIFLLILAIIYKQKQ